MLGLALLFGFVVRTTMDQYRGVAAERERLVVEAAAESALHDHLFGLLAPGLRASGDFRLDASVDRFSVTSGPSDGLIDLNQADEQLLARLFGQRHGSDAQAAPEKLRLKRPIASYAELVAAMGLGEPELACLLQQATLFSARRVPDPDVAPASVKALLEVRPPTSNAPGSVATFGTKYARPWWIQIEVRASGGAMRRLRTEVIITNRADRPFGVLDRRWLDPNVSFGSCT